MSGCTVAQRQAKQYREINCVNNSRLAKGYDYDYYYYYFSVVILSEINKTISFSFNVRTAPRPQMPSDR